MRLRLVTLAEIPEEWSERVRVWHRILARESRALDDASLEYFFYQTLLGSYPVSGDFSRAEYRERLSGAMTKAAREARRRTSWSRPNEEFENALTGLIDGALESAPFLDDFVPFQQRIARAGADNSLVQLALKLTSPGVPDIYQGAELWDLSLVDPDNRRPVDYEARARLLDDLLERWRRDPAGTLRETASQWQDGRIKLLLTTLLLRLRSEHEALFAGEYLPCEVAGSAVHGAYLRRAGDRALLVVFRRFPFASRRDAGPARVELPTELGTWTDVLRRVADISREGLMNDLELPVGIYLSGAAP